MGQTKARHALEGLATGDAFGERFFRDPATVSRMLEERALPEGPWRYTDDTEEALALYESLVTHDGLDVDDFAERMVERYHARPNRGYGGGAHELFGELGEGKPWREAAGQLFGGSGSFGNGSAMRVAPLGAWYADDLARCAHAAVESAAPTHAHPEGAAGAVAIAVGTAAAAGADEASDIWEATLHYVPCSDVHRRIVAAAELPLDTPVAEAADRLGNGSRVSCQDTVAFCLWCAARHLDDYEEALWTTVSGGGDRDTTCAIVGGILGARLGVEAIPDLWLDRREDLDLEEA